MFSNDFSGKENGNKISVDDCKILCYNKLFFKISSYYAFHFLKQFFHPTDPYNRDLHILVFQTRYLVTIYIHH